MILTLLSKRTAPSASALSSQMVLPSQVVLTVLLFLCSLGGASTEQVFGTEVSAVSPAIRFYQRYISDLRYGHCRFTPSCSEYALQAVERYGYVGGTALAADRLIRCNRDAWRFYERGSDRRLLDPVGEQSARQHGVATAPPLKPQLDADPTIVTPLFILDEMLVPPFELFDGDSVRLDAATLDKLREYAAFADALAEEGDCERAATEYKRVAFLGGGSVFGAWAQMKISRCYFVDKSWDASAEEFSKVTTQKGASLREKEVAQLMSATSLFNSGQYLRCKKLLLAPLDTTNIKASLVSNHGPSRLADIGPALTDETSLLLALCEMGRGKWDDARLTLNDIAEGSSESRYKQKALSLSTMVRKGPELPHKNSRLATALSVFIPGSGQVYAGRTSDGLRHFAVDVLLIYATARLVQDESYAGAYLLAGITIPFYLGNVMGAGASAEAFNQRSRERFLANAIQRMDRQTGGH
jgi:putative membrane protein insertion efficiency factor